MDRRVHTTCDTLAAANCLLDIPAEVTEIAAGAQVQIWDLVYPTVRMDA